MTTTHKAYMCRGDKPSSQHQLPRARINTSRLACNHRYTTSCTGMPYAATLNKEELPACTLYTRKQRIATIAQEAGQLYSKLQSKHPHILTLWQCPEP